MAMKHSLNADPVEVAMPQVTADLTQAVILTICHTDCPGSKHLKLDVSHKGTL